MATVHQLPNVQDNTSIPTTVISDRTTNTVLGLDVDRLQYGRGGYTISVMKAALALVGIIPPTVTSRGNNFLKQDYINLLLSIYTDPSIVETTLAQQRINSTASAIRNRRFDTNVPSIYVQINAVDPPSSRTRDNDYLPNFNYTVILRPTTEICPIYNDVPDIYLLCKGAGGQSEHVHRVKEFGVWANRVDNVNCLQCKGDVDIDTFYINTAVVKSEKRKTVKKTTERLVVIEKPTVVEIETQTDPVKTKKTIKKTAAVEKPTVAEIETQTVPVKTKKKRPVTVGLSVTAQKPIVAEIETQTDPVKTKKTTKRPVVTHISATVEI